MLKKTFFSRHVDDLKRMWSEYEEKATTSTDDYTQIDHIIDQIEANLSKKNVQVKV